MKLAILDYGMGNLTSLRNGCRKATGRGTLVRTPSALDRADALIIPGVGAFGDGARGLRPFARAIRDKVDGGSPVLGICLGMQVLFERSEESPGASGLGLLKGSVKRLRPRGGLPVPQMGWNSVKFKGASPLFEGLNDGDYFYFAHSYACVPKARKEWAGSTDYGGRVCAAVQQGSLFGVQFHPEKSGPSGLKILENFADLAAKQRGKGLNPASSSPRRNERVSEGLGTYFVSSAAKG